jgi:hypothetical protein
MNHQNNNLNPVEYFQQNNSPLPPIPKIDYNYILVNRGLKYLLNFIFIYFFVTIIICNYPSINVEIFILLICAVSSISFYILDVIFPSCYI